MSSSGKPISDLGFDSVTDRFRDSLNHSDCNSNTNKPDFRELDLGSPVSPLRTRQSNRPTHTTTTTTTTSSSSSSSGSVSGRNGVTHVAGRSNSGGKDHSSELSGSVDSSPTGSRAAPKPGHRRSDSGTSHPLIYSGGGSVSSPPPNVLPAGNICPSGRVLKTGMVNRSSKTEVLGLGKANYGHGSIMRGGTPTKSCVGGGGGEGGIGDLRNGDSARRVPSVSDPEEVKKAGNEQYKLGHFSEALSLYDRAISMSPRNATYRFNRAAALTGLRRLEEAVRECEEAVGLDPGYVKAHHRLGSLLLRLGQVEYARRHICFPGHKPDQNDLQKLQEVEAHVSKCSSARKIGDWRIVLKEAEAAIASGADACSQLYASKAESFLKLHQLEDATLSLSSIPKIDPSTPSSMRSKFFGMMFEAYIYFVQAQVDLAFGRFENAVTAAERAAKIDPEDREVAYLLNKVRLVSRARVQGNDLFKSGKFTEACSAYGEGLRLDPSNSVLYCNRAACWYKLGLWEHSLDDCNQALTIQPNYTKALLRRATSNSKLERWVEAVRDYEVLRRELPDDNEVAESLFRSQVALRKSREEDIHDVNVGGEIELVSDLEQFRSAISPAGASLVHFENTSNLRCKQISRFLITLCDRYTSMKFIKVDVEKCSEIAAAEKVRIVPTFKIYKSGSQVKEMVTPTPEVLESSVRHYSL